MIVVVPTLASTKPLITAYRSIRVRNKPELRVYYPHEVNEEEVELKEFEEKLKEASAVLIDVRGGGKVEEVLHRTLKGENNVVVTLIGSPKLMSLTRLGSFTMEKFSEKFEEDSRLSTEELYKRARRIQSIIEIAGRLPIASLRDARNYVKVLKYYSYGGEENYRNMFITVLRYLGYELPEPGEPEERHEIGVYHPKLGFLREPLPSEEKPSVGVLIYGGMHFDQCVPPLKALVERLEDLGVCVTPVYVESTTKTLEGVRRFFFKHGKPAVDAVISLLWFRLNGGPLGGDPRPTLALLKELNVPVFCPAPMYMREVSSWERSPTGLSPIEIICAVVWPELDGCVEPIPCCGLKSEELEGVVVKDTLPIEDRIKRVVARVGNWISLKTKRNEKKRLAIVLYDYPPGEANIGSAAYLDTFESVKRLLERLKAEGYVVEVPENLKELFEGFAVVNSGRWLDARRTLRNCPSVELQEYRRWFEELPEELRRDVVESWGPPPGNVMVEGGRILIPGVWLGNVFVCLQPSRGVHESPEKAYHDKKLPPHHQYIAFYKYLQREVDAVIHVGTHGTLEFQKGKEVGLSSKCFPDVLIGNLPHVYIYHVLNTSEGSIARRRSYATLVSYNSPPYTTSDLYGDLLELEDMINEFHEASVQDPRRVEALRRKIMEKAESLHLDGESVEEIHDELIELKRSVIPKGLHVLGGRYSEEELVDFVRLLLRYDRSDLKSLNRILAENKGLNYDELLKHPGKHARTLEEIEKEAEELVKTLLLEGVGRAVKRSGVSRSLRAELRRTLEFGLSAARKFQKNDAELENVVRALSCEFVEPGPGGDVLRNPEALPTGRNIYQFDPNLIPTQTACERGAEIAENTIRHFLEKHGRYPEGVGVVLWGFETTKTGGETIGQILHYLGVRLKRRGAWGVELEVVPLEELRRPRIDVLVNICGFFRDMFPNVLQLLSRAFELVASLDEPPDRNFVRKHALEAREVLKESSPEAEAEISEERFWRLASARIFGPDAGEYGTRVTTLIETSNWEEEKQLAEAYIGSMSHVYAENVHAERAGALYRKLLSTVELVSQIRDSHDYEITDLDHYYEFFGGLSKAVETVGGRKPEMLITDTTKEVLRTEEVSRVIRRGVRARLLNPKWIDEMLKHDFHGAQKIADRVEYLLGLAATTGGVESWVFGEVARRFIFDEAMRRRLAENNKWAAAEVIERLLEAARRGYWRASEAELERLREAYLEIEGRLEDAV